MDRITKYLIILAFIGAAGCDTGAPCGPSCLKGDVDGDGAIGAFDAALALNIVLGNLEPTEEQFCAADLNGDGRVTHGDSQAIFAYAELGE